MATKLVNVENGFFAGNVNPTQHSTNGWDCSISENGTITCSAVWKYSDGEHSIHYMIQPSGFAKLTLKTPYKTKTLRKGYVVPKGMKLSNGVIGLAGGYIDNRYAYYRDSSFQKFLEEHKISAIKHEDPNQVFDVRNAQHGRGSCYSSLNSAGTIAELSSNLDRSDDWEAR